MGGSNSGGNSPSSSKNPKKMGDSTNRKKIVSVVELKDVDVTPVVFETTPYTDQKPGTSGVRKKTRHFMQKNYLENFIQATLDAVRSTGAVEMNTLLIASDGRYYAPNGIQIVTDIALANGVKEILIGVDGQISTPAVSAVIRERLLATSSTNKNRIFGCFILTASHNPGGIDEDFGIKYNGPTGGPDEIVYQLMYENSCKIKEYKRCSNLGSVIGRINQYVKDVKGECGVSGGDVSGCDVSGDQNLLAMEPGTKFIFGEGCSIEIIDSAESHCKLLEQIFDFEEIKKLIAHPKFSAMFDCMSGVQGQYATKILVEKLGLDPGCILRGIPKPDFGGKSEPHHGHADPNLTHAWDLVNKLGIDTKGKPLAGDPENFPYFGAAWDGDADRNMILGRQFFVIPSDSIAILVDNVDSCVPFFKKANLRSAARSMPTSRALDVVCEKRGIKCFETPTGWKFFGNLMESGDGPFVGKPVYKPLICGEEAFGTSSDHAREKDGMWAVLCWLQLLAHKNKDMINNPKGSDKLLGVSDVAAEHWLKYGRHYYARWDWEEIDGDKARRFFSNLEENLEQLKNKKLDPDGEYTISGAEQFNYTDPVDGSSTRNQGVKVFFTNGSRVVFRLSGTGVVGVTIRVYLEKYVPSSAGLQNLVLNHLDQVTDFGKAIIKLVGIGQWTGIENPTLMT